MIEIGPADRTQTTAVGVAEQIHRQFKQQFFADIFRDVADLHPIRNFDEKGDITSFHRLLHRGKTAPAFPGDHRAAGATHQRAAGSSFHVKTVFNRRDHLKHFIMVKFEKFRRFLPGQFNCLLFQSGR